jgi:limonene-1,2-epoxide hydrolase
MGTGVDAVTQLCAHWPTMSAAEIAALFTDGAVYRNMPWSAEDVGGAAIGGRLTQSAPWSAVDCNILHVFDQGSTVCAERLEVFHLASGETFPLPVVGVFELEGDRISAWRDYFDPAPFRALQKAAAQPAE